MGGGKKKSAERDQQQTREMGKGTRSKLVVPRDKGQKKGGVRPGKTKSMGGKGEWTPN